MAMPQRRSSIGMVAESTTNPGLGSVTSMRSVFFGHELEECQAMYPVFPRTFPVLVCCGGEFNFAVGKLRLNWLLFISQLLVGVFYI